MHPRLLVVISLAFLINLMRSSSALIKEGRKTSNVTHSGIGEPLLVASWNIQRLGKAKMSNPKVVAAIVHVMRRYDIVAVMEIVDAEGIVPSLLKEALNEGAAQEDLFDFVISERLGRTSYKEQYAFYYKPSRVSVVSTFQFDDSAQDVFQTEPFSALFSAALEGLDVFALTAIHIKPADAPKEIDALVDVYEAVTAAFSTEGVIIMGDFNAGCDYVVTSDWSQIRLATDNRIHWLIDDHADTTTGLTTCPYDRIVVAGNTLRSVIFERSVGPFYFDEAAVNISDPLLNDISDHYPVEVKLKGALSEEVKNKVKVRKSLGEVRFFSTFLTAGDCTQGFIYAAEMTAVTLPDLENVLNDFQNAHPDILPEEALSVMLYKAVDYAALNYLGDASAINFEVQIICFSGGRCKLTASVPSEIYA